MEVYKTNQVKRSIYYYEWFTHSHDKKTNELIIDKTSKKITDFLTGLYDKQVECDGYKDFVVNTTHGQEFLIIDRKDDKKICFRIFLTRTNALPYVEKDGKIEELGNVISKDQNIAEVTHCVFFIQYGILGVEYNANGARAKSVSEYMIRYTKNEEDMPSCRIKLKYDVYSKLIQGDSFSLFDFSVRTNSEAYNNVLANKSIFCAIQAAVPESDTIEVVLRKRKTKKNKETGFSLPISFDDIKDLLANYREDIMKFEVSQGKRSEAVDLLADKFVGKALLVKTDNRTIDSQEMYQAICSYFTSDVEDYCN